MLLVLLGLTHPLYAQVPNRLAYQGLIADETGQLIDDGAIHLVFRLYDQEEGGEVLYEETQQLTVESGLISTFIGLTKTLALPFDRPYWLTVEVEGQSESARMALSSAPYSLLARDVADGAVVRSISGLKDVIELVGGEGISIEQQGNRLIISAAGAQGLTGYGPDETARRDAPSIKATSPMTEQEDEEAIKVLLETLGLGGSNVGLDAAYDDGRVITLDDGRISMNGSGVIGLELNEADLLLREAVGGSPNLRLRVDGLSTVQQYKLELDAATGDLNLVNSTAATTPLKIEKDAADGLLTLDGGRVLVQGTGVIGLELNEADLLLREAVGGSPNLRLRVDGLSTVQQYKLELDAATGDLNFVNSTAAATPLKIEKDAPDGLVKLDATGLVVTAPPPPPGAAAKAGATGGTITIDGDKIIFPDASEQTTAPTGGGGGGMVFAGVLGVNANQTVFVMHGNSSTGEAFKTIIVPRDGTFKNLYFYAYNSPVAVGAEVKANVRIDGTDTTLEVTLVNSDGLTAVSDLTHEILVTAGQKFTIRVRETLNVTPGNSMVVVVSFE